MGAPPLAGWPMLRNAWYRGRISPWDALPSGRPCQPIEMPYAGPSPAHRACQPIGMPYPGGCPTHMACPPIGMPGCLGRIGPWDAGARREGGPEGGRISLHGHAAPRWRLVLAWGWCSSRRTAVAALRVAPGLGCTPKKWQRRGPASRLPRPGAAASPAMGGPPPGSMTLRGPAAPMAPVSFRPGGPQTRHSPRGSPRSRAVLPPPLS